MVALLIARTKEASGGKKTKEKKPMATTTTAAAPSSFDDQDGLPRGVSASTTGVFVLDVLALATMAACMPTLKLFVKKRRHWNLVSWRAVSLLEASSEFFFLLLLL